MNELRRAWQRRLAARICGWSALSALILWAIAWTEPDFRMLAASGPRFQEFLSRLVPPDWSVTSLVVRSAVETLMIAIAGTALAALAALPLGFLAASNISPPWISQPVKWLLGLIRSIPVIIVGILFVTAVGLGPFPGMLAIAFHSIGMLGKFYAEEFETAKESIIAAVRDTGASRAQVLRHGLFPQSLPQVVAFTVFRLEMNFRDAAVLGLVGAGGIGFYIKSYIEGFQYEKVGVLLLVILVVVTALDLLTFWARRAVR